MPVFERESRVTSEKHILMWGDSEGYNHLEILIDHTQGSHMSEKFHDDFVRFVHDWARENFKGGGGSPYDPTHQIVYTCQDQETIPVETDEGDDNP